MNSFRYWTQLGALLLTALAISSCGSPSTPHEAEATKTPAVETQAKEVVNEEPKAEAPKVVEPTPTPQVSEKLEDSPTEVIKKYTAELRSLVDLTVPKEKRSRDTRREAKIAEKVRQFFDFPGLARLSLGRHWMKVTDAQRKEYSDLFITLIEDSYLRRSRDLVGEYEVAYGKEEISGNRSKVFSRVMRSDADVEIVYELHKNPKDWMIFNIVLDGVDLIRNYQSQFNRIIEQESFSALLQKMRKKKSEIDKDNGL